MSLYIRIHVPVIMNESLYVVDVSLYACVCVALMIVQTRLRAIQGDGQVKASAEV